MSTKVNNTSTGVKVILKDGYSKEINKIKRRQSNQELNMDDILDEVLLDLNRVSNAFANSFINEMETILKQETPFDNSATREAERASRRNRKRLKDTIKKKIKKNGKYSIELFVGWDRDYGKIAGIVNDGSPKHPLAPKNKYYLSWPLDREDASSEWLYIYGGFFHPGFQGRNMVNIAGEQIKVILEDRFDRTLNSIL